ncbi:hypothetical protein MBRA1_002161 [Malassezia brasiliensis]|uniref:Cyclin-like domain-containing protein n=1 Tax=Malassezia brasiliensis TaxID=1821822 RepID=A0AAF0DU54_9BASI|nr:hypothetical protein MBRA1_002161 [Malassezia brasiliensis]
MDGAPPAAVAPEAAWTVQTAPLSIEDPVVDVHRMSVPSFGPRPSYLQSSQAQHWTFSTGQLAQLRSEANQQAAHALKQYASDAKVDELAIIRFYLLRIGRLVRAFHLPSLIESSAMTLMKRFYLRNSCMQFHPKLIMLTSIYLASKAENYPLPLAKFCAQVNEASAGKQATAPTKASAARGDVTENIIRDLEFGMVQSLDFELAVHGAQRALYGLILDFQTLPNPLSREDLTVFAAAVQGYVQSARLTDAEFTYAPPHIALAACWMCETKGATGTISGKDVVRKWLAAKRERASTARVAQLEARTNWRAKKQALEKAQQDESSKQAPSPATSEPAASLDYRAENLKDSGGLLPSAQLEHILDAIAAQIRSLAPDTPAGAPLKPQVDMEQVKKIDLALRACLLLFESGNQSNSRKRGAQDDDGRSKRQRTDASVDSDDEL